MKTAGISGVGLAAVAAGGLFAYAGFRGVSPLQALKDLTSGNPPAITSHSTSTVGVGTGDVLMDVTGNATSALILGKSPGALVSAASHYIGVPYKWGGMSKSGVDCSGLVVLAFQDAYGITPPRTTYQQEVWSKLKTTKSPQAGDLVFWPGHVAIYVGSGNVIHAPRPGKSVEVVPVSQAHSGSPHYMTLAGQSSLVKTG